MAGEKEVINLVVSRLLRDFYMMSSALCHILLFAVFLTATSYLLANEPAKGSPALSGAISESSLKSEDSEKSAPADGSSASGETAESAAKPSLLGDPLAPGKLQLLKQEIMSGLVKRQITDNFARFHSYTGFKLNSSAGRYTGSELTGNCRLSWYEHLLRNHLEAPVEAERFTRELHKAALGNQEGFSEIVAIAAKKMDLGQQKPRNFCQGRIA